MFKPFVPTTCSSHFKSKYLKIKVVPYCMYCTVVFACGLEKKFQCSQENSWRGACFSGNLPRNMFVFHFPSFCVLREIPWCFCENLPFFQQGNFPSNIVGSFRQGNFLHVFHWVHPSWGIPVGNGARFYALQVHYYNPTLDTGVRDSSGVRMTLSPALRTHDAWPRFSYKGAHLSILYGWNNKLLKPENQGLDP